MKKYFAVFVLFALFPVCGCGKLEGTLITQTFDVYDSYTSLDVSSAFDVRIDDSVDRITVVACDELMPYIEVHVENNTLKIKTRRNKFRTGNGRKVLLPRNANLGKVVLSGASKFWGDIQSDRADVILSGASKFLGDVSAESINLNLSGSSNFEGRVDTDDLDIVLSGASRADVVGHTISMSFNLSGASCVKSPMADRRYTLSCDNCYGELSGASNIYLHCNEEMKIKTSGASKVHYTGNARLNISGDASVGKDDF